MYKDTMLIKQLKMENKIWYLWDFFDWHEDFMHIILLC